MSLTAVHRLADRIRGAGEGKPAKLKGLYRSAATRLLDGEFARAGMILGWIDKLPGSRSSQVRGFVRDVDRLLQETFGVIVRRGAQGSYAVRFTGAWGLPGDEPAGDALLEEAKTVLKIQTSSLYGKIKNVAKTKTPKARR